MGFQQVQTGMGAGKLTWCTREGRRRCCGCRTSHTGGFRGDVARLRAGGWVSEGDGARFGVCGSFLGAGRLTQAVCAVTWHL